jgi:hypothetical protein
MLLARQCFQRRGWLPLRSEQLREGHAALLLLLLDVWLVGMRLLLLLVHRRLCLLLLQLLHGRQACKQSAGPPSTRRHARRRVLRRLLQLWRLLLLLGVVRQRGTARLQERRQRRVGHDWALRLLAGRLLRQQVRRVVEVRVLGQAGRRAPKER